MKIELTPDRVQLLRELVEERIDELGPEIHHTRTPDYHEDLKALRETLKALHAVLNQPEAEAAA